MAGVSKSKRLQFVVPLEVGEVLEQMAEQAKARGADVSVSIVARSLIQAAIHMPKQKAIALEIAMQAFAEQIRISNSLRQAMLDKLEEIVGDGDEAV